MMRLLPNRRTLPWWLLAISIAFNLGFGATYGARTYRPAPGGRGLGGGGVAMVYAHEGLDLSTDQQAQIETIHEDLLAEIVGLRREIRDARLRLADLLDEREIDPQAVDGQLDAISATQRDAQEIVVNHLIREKQVLRPEQYDAFGKVIRDRVCPGNGMGRGGGMGRGMGRGPGKGRGRGQPNGETP
jgi:Spy/CpxP family protein refolding chaperone